MNTWDNIKTAQIAHDLIHRESDNKNIADFDPSCIYCAGDSKSRTRNYKNFLIYLTNYYQLTDVTNETNLTFKKFSRKLEILIQENEKDNNKDIAKSARKNTEDIFEIIRFVRISKISNVHFLCPKHLLSQLYIPTICPNRILLTIKIGHPVA